MSNELIYNGITIRDRDDMLSLTDMWRAAGSPSEKRPNDWRSLPGTQQFCDYVAENLNTGNSGNEIFQAVRGGANPGTWAHWQIGFAYAKYLSPPFHAWCNEVVRTHMEGKRLPPSLRLDDLSAEVRAALGGIVRSVVHKQLTEILPAMIADGIAADPRRGVIDGVTALELAIKAGALQRKRRGLVVEISNGIAGFCLAEGVAIRHTESGTRLFPVDIAQRFMEAKGNRLVVDHNESITGQGVIQFPKPKRRRSN